MGRPTKRTLVVDHDENGKPITLEQQLLSDVRLGLPVDRACARVGIVVDTYYDWLRVGNRLRTAPPLDPHTRTPRRLDRNEKALIAFSEAALKAEADGMALLALHVVDAATQTSTTTRTIVKTRKVGDTPVEIVERTVTTETHLPDWRAALELLQRRWPKEYGRTDRHEHTGEDGEAIPVSMRIEHILTAAAQTAELYEQAATGTNGNGKILELNPRENGDRADDDDR